MAVGSPSSALNESAPWAVRLNTGELPFHSPSAFDHFSDQVLVHQYGRAIVRLPRLR